MKDLELTLQQKVDISEAIATGELVAFNCTCDREIILAIATKSLDYRRYNKSGSYFAKVKTKTGQNCFYAASRIFWFWFVELEKLLLRRRLLTPRFF